MLVKGIPVNFIETHIFWKMVEYFLFKIHVILQKYEAAEVGLRKMRSEPEYLCILIKRKRDIGQVILSETI